MNLNILYNQIPELPKLAWLACLNLDGKTLDIFHGSSVECHDDWMVEGVWDGEFEQGGFHRSENFFGSGIRIEDNKVYFVPSSALVDRLLYCVDKGRIVVSNSLITLLGFTGAKLNESHDYHEESLSILKGIRDYQKQFSIIHPDIKCFYQIFCNNIVVSSGGSISFEVRSRLRKINSFDQYYKLLTEALHRIKKNYESSARKFLFSPYTTLSSGYDSTAVTCLAKELGVKTCFTARKSSSMIPRLFSKYSVDDGTRAAKDLKLNIRYLDPPDSNISENELYFLALPYAKFSGEALNEIAFHSMASYIEKNCEVAVVFCGYHGDKVWDVHTKGKYLSDQIIRGDTSGLGLSEIRLKSGFINLAVPFIEARNIKDLAKISWSSEMKPWRLNNSYDRPIARRIAESLGADRQSFGIRKKAVCRYYRYPRNWLIRKRFFQFMKENYKVCPHSIYFSHALNQIGLFSQKILKNVGLSSGGYKRTVFLSYVDFPYLMWIWSAGILSQGLANIFIRYKKGSEEE